MSTAGAGYLADHHKHPGFDKLDKYAEAVQSVAPPSLAGTQCLQQTVLPSIKCGLTEGYTATVPVHSDFGTEQQQTERSCVLCLREEQCAQAWSSPMHYHHGRDFCHLIKTA